MAVEGFVNLTLALLDEERETEIRENQFLTENLSAKELQKRGVCLLKLIIQSRRSGLYGRTVLVFEPQAKRYEKGGNVELPSHNFSPGDIVGVACMKSFATDKPLATGIVSQVKSFSISLAFDESQDVFSLDDEELYKLTKLANDVTYRRLKATLNDLAKQTRGPSQKIVDTFFCLAEISSPGGDFPITFVNPNLDASQQNAVRFALTQKEVAIIHGPPGTGKTTTLVELIIQTIRTGSKVLATASSNVAVDNLVEKLAAFKQRIVRIGHPARLLSHLQKYSLDAIVSGSEEKSIARDVKTDIDKVMNKLRKARGKGERAALRTELKGLKKELTEREVAATREILSRADVVLVTLTSATNDGPLKYLKEDHFDVVVIDECSQALEAACWIGLLKAPRCVLAGDHLQLPPTILSKEAAKKGLELTLMERLLKTLVEEKGKDVMRMLTTQYRMHTDIMQWASDQLYQGKLTSHPSVACHLLKDLDEIAETEATCKPLMLIDTAGCDHFELDLADEVSKGNEGEADIVASHVEDLIKSGVKAKDIAVIAPYNLQVDLLRVRLSQYLPDLEVKSVDGFQGREKEAVVISMVRSNLKGEVGFLAEKRRINVAVTRARRHLAVVCDSETVCRDAFIKTLIDYISEHGEVLSAHQYAQEATCSRPDRLTNVMESEKLNKKHKPDKLKSKPQQSSDLQSVVLKSKEEKMTEYDKILMDFVLSNEPYKDFPPSLNSHDRMVIHEISERLGLNHISLGEGKTRFLRVSRDSGKVLASGMADTSTVDTIDDVHITEETTSVEQGSNSFKDSNTTTSVFEEVEDTLSCSNNINRCNEEVDIAIVEASSSNETIGKTVIVTGELDKDLKGLSLSVNEKDATPASDPELRVCPHCQKNIRSHNFVLHEVHCASKTKLKQQEVSHERQKDSGARKKEISQKARKQGSAKVSHVQKAAEVLKKVDCDDFDAMLDSIKKLDSKCAVRKCKTLTNTLGRNCEFCTRRFCLTHLMPEIHGCGDAVKEAAKRIISRDGVLHQGSGVPNHKPNAARRGMLEKRMEKKMDEFSGKRTRKKKDES